jgi:hypothetical protein
MSNAGAHGSGADDGNCLDLGHKSASVNHGGV